MSYPDAALTFNFTSDIITLHFGRETPLGIVSKLPLSHLLRHVLSPKFCSDIYRLTATVLEKYNGQRTTQYAAGNVGKCSRSQLCYERYISSFHRLTILQGDHHQ